MNEINEKVRAFEGIFLRLDEQDLQCNSKLNFIIYIEINELGDRGSYYIKMREAGIILNNSQLVPQNSIIADATISCHYVADFCKIVDLGDSLEDSISKGVLKQKGTADALEFFWNTILKSCQSSPQQRRRSLTSNTENMKPLKSGYLEKKRDIMGGWRKRYFIVYVGRLEYFTDQDDSLPRDVLSIVGADISKPKRVTVNGVSDHFCVLVEPRNRDKAVRLASQASGDRGYQEICEWFQVLQDAAHSSDSTKVSKSPPSTAPTSPSMPSKGFNLKAMLSQASHLIHRQSAANLYNTPSRPGSGRMTAMDPLARTRGNSVTQNLGPSRPTILKKESSVKLKSSTQKPDLSSDDSGGEELVGQNGEMDIVKGGMEVGGQGTGLSFVRQIPWALLLIFSAMVYGGYLTAGVNGALIWTAMLIILIVSGNITNTLKFT